MKNIKYTHNINNKRAISLLVLVITIVVVLILASAIILQVRKNNITKDALEYRFKSDITTILEDYRNYSANNFLSNAATAEGFNKSLLTVTRTGTVIYDGIEQEGKTITDILPSIKGTDYEKLIYIKDGVIYIVGSSFTSEERAWISEQGMNVTDSETDEIILSDNNITIVKGYTKKIKATILSENNGDRIEWRSDNEEIATVDDNGNIKAIKSGNTIVTASIVGRNVEAKCNITVTDISYAVLDIKLSKSTVILSKGDTEGLVATITPANATNKKVKWSSDNSSVATVDNNGNITGISSGETTVKATTEDGGKVASCKVIVSIKIEGLTLSDENVILAMNESKNLIATINPEGATNKDIIWESSNEESVIVDNYGKIKAVGPGTSVITATSKSNSKFTAKCKVTVNIPVTGIEISKTSLNITIGKIEKLNTTVLPDNATNKNVIWQSSDSKVATVDNNGNITGISSGTAIVTAKTEDGNKTISCNVTVQKNISSVTLNKTNLSLKKGQTQQLIATVMPSGGGNSEVIFESSNSSIVSVDQNGNIVAKAVGEVVISAVSKYDSAKRATCKVIVTTPITITASISDVTANSANILLNTNTTLGTITEISLNYKKVEEDSYFSVGTYTPNLSTDTRRVNIASLDSNTSYDVQVIVKTSENDNYTLYTSFTTKSVAVTSISLNKSSTKLGIGQTEMLEAILEPSGTDSGVIWESSNPNIVTVDEKGVLTAKAIGTATIIAKASENIDITASCSVNVISPITVSAKQTASTLNSVSYNVDAITTVGILTNINVSYKMENETNYTNSNTINPNSITYNNSLNISELSANTTYDVRIIVSNNKNYSKTIYIKCTTSKIDVTSINLNTSNITLDIGQTTKLTATVLPDNATVKGYTWESGDNFIATVDSSGNVVALNEGTAIITAISNDNPNIKGVCTVNVKSPLTFNSYVSSYSSSSINIYINASTKSGNIQQIEVYYKKTTESSYTLKTTLSPNTSSYSTTYGITGVTQDNTYDIKVVATTSSGYKKTIEFEGSTSKIAVSSISLNKSEVILRTNDKTIPNVNTSETLVATINPSTATEKGVIWESSNQSIATVNQDGTIIAKGTGEVNITAKSKDDNSKVATCRVMVNPVVRIDTKYYFTLQNAFDDVPNTSTWTEVQLLDNITEENVPTLKYSEQYIEIYLNGKTIYSGLENYGDILIFESGTITKDSGIVIINHGSLFFENTDCSVISQNGYAIVNDGYLESYGNPTISGADGIQNFGNMAIYSGTIIGREDDAIEHYKGTIELNGGTIEGQYGVWGYDDEPEKRVLKLNNDVEIIANYPSSNSAGTCIYLSSGDELYFNGGTLNSNGNLLTALSSAFQGNIILPSGKNLVNSTQNGRTTTKLGIAVARRTVSSENYYYEKLQNAFDVSSINSSSSSPAQIYLLTNVTECVDFGGSVYATLNMNGYTLTSSINSTNNPTLINRGNLTLSGTGTLSGSGSRTINNTSGTLKIQGPTISKSSASYETIYNNGGTLEFISGIIESTSTSNSNAIEISSGTVNIRGGTVRNYASGATIYQVGGTLNLDNNNSSISTTSPVVQNSYNTTGTAYAINKNGGTFNFYDGKIIGKGSAITGTVNGVPSGYNVVVNKSGNDETATLGIAVAKIGSKYYSTLQNAFNNVTTTSSSSRNNIELLKDIEISSTATFPSGKYATLNMSSYNITGSLSSSYLIANYGNLNITASSSNMIKNNSYRAISNSPSGATMSLTGVKVTGTGSYGIYNVADLTINTNATVHSTNDYGVFNNSLLTVAGGEITTSGSTYACYSVGTLNMTSGNISGNDGLNVASGTATISGGTVTGTNNVGIYLSATLNINGGTINGKSDGIRAPSTSAITNMTAGSIVSTNNSGISTDSKVTVTGGSVTGIYGGATSTITIGTNDSTVSTTSPSITNKKDGDFAIHNNGGKFYYYDGVLTSRKPSSTTASTVAITGGITGMPTNYETISKGSKGNSQVVTLYSYTKNITNESQLNKLATVVNSGYSLYGMTINLRNNINLTSTSYTPIGNASNPFRGTFEGINNTISNINVSSTTNYTGLFGYSFGIVRNVIIDNSNISGTSYVSGIVAFNQGNVIGCKVKNSNITGSGSYIGGIVGDNRNEISKCSVMTTRIKGTGTVGGIVGDNFSQATVTDCYNSGYFVSASNNVGGIAGNNVNNSTIERSYNRAYVISSSNPVGGIVGNIGGGSITNVYNAGKVVGSSNVGPVVGKTSISAASTWYYLSGVCSNSTNTYTTSKTDTNLKASTMVTTLGSSYWKQLANVNTGYPILINNTQGSGAELFEVDNSTDTSVNNTKFKKVNDTLEPRNYGVNNTVAHTMLKIDLSSISSSYSYRITVNANVTSESNYDFGYATVNTSTAVPAYNTTTGQFMKISGTISAKDYTTTISGGSIHYLHLCYRKDSSNSATNEKFVVNGISITPVV